MRPLFPQADAYHSLYKKIELEIKHILLKHGPSYGKHIKRLTKKLDKAYAKWDKAEQEIEKYLITIQTEENRTDIEESVRLSLTKG